MVKIMLIRIFYPKTAGIRARNQHFVGMSRTVFKRSLDWYLRDNTFSFDGKYYVQIDGIAMGTPMAHILADIFMNHILENNILHSTDNNNSFLDIIFAGTVNIPQFKLKLFVRYVDDTLVAFENKTDATKFLRYLNSLHNNLEFTIEQENNNVIPFLDLLIIRDRIN